MSRGKGIAWDAPAAETVEGGPEDKALWEWARDEMEGGRARTDVAKEVGCHAQSMMSALKKRGVELERRKPGNPAKGERPGAATATAEEPADNIGTEVTITRKEEPEAPSEGGEGADEPPVRVPVIGSRVDVHVRYTPEDLEAFIRETGQMENFVWFALGRRSREVRELWAPRLN